jgi:ATP-dependent RNA helicase HrpA
MAESRSRHARQARWDALAGRLRYPAELPITARRDELLAAIRDHQVVVVAGETGSGKSTQLPKMCLELGRGVGGLIGHTQPRRVAARTIAERIASELGTTIGGTVSRASPRASERSGLVAYSVRFDDRVGEGTLLRVMTDGILLAELGRDRELRRYDTLIIDEAHERSLNIDFILGYLRQLLPRRPDLKVIVTSATIDTARFARHFARSGVDAPVVEVSGRTHPVEVRYRPYDDHGDQVQAISDAVDELAGLGDTLVFLSGEREIHDTADHLRRRQLPDTEVLPLYARLSAPEQHRIFEPHRGRRIVLSTNVAETSITVPGVRTVIDAGTARISRYSRRLKVQRLPIEPVSKASADQRAGRCGRVAPGVCIRLYGEDDFDARPPFTEPEILRTNLASVILQMTAIGLGDVASFPFVEPPDHASIRDGYLLLEELAAIEEADAAGRRRLTPLGRKMARLPVDPRLGRMILESERNGCVREVIVIAAALSIRDPRERPEDQIDAANAAHKRFDVGGSDLLSIVALWDHLRAQQRALSGNQFRRLCRAEFVNHLRVREWQDLFSQLRRVAGDLGIRAGHDPPPSDGIDGGRVADRVHQAVLAGLLSHIGMRDRDSRELKGARGSAFTIARGSVLARRPPRWVMAAELVETDRLWARRVAAIEPAWAERLGEHLVRRSYGEARWEAERAAAVTTETVTLYGLPIVSGRTVPLDRIDRRLAREMFVRCALGDGQWSTHHPFVARNVAFRSRISGLEARVRRRPLLDSNDIEDFYDERLPADVTSGRRFDSWWKGVGDPHLLDLTDDVVAGRTGFRADDYPDTWRQGDLVLPLSYRFDPGGPLDGVSVHVPLTALNRVTDDGFDWQVPGHRSDLVGVLVRSLPKDVRRQLIPMAGTIDKAIAVLGEPAGRLVDAVAAALTAVSGVGVTASMMDPSVVPPHLRVHVIVTDADGEVRDADDDLDAIKRRLAASAREAIADAAPIAERRGMVTWDVGTIPHTVSATESGIAVTGYPALLDDDTSVSLRVLTNPDLQRRVMRGGVRRLLLLTVPPPTRDVVKGLTPSGRLAIARSGFELDGLVSDCAFAAVDRVVGEQTLPWDAEAFADLQRIVRREAPGIAAGALARCADVLGEAAAVGERVAKLTAPALQRSVADASAHLDRLVRPRFVVRAGASRLDDVARYIRAIAYRLDRLAGDVGRDRRRMDEVVPLEDEFAALVRRGATGAAVVELGWRLEELRVSVFAQPIGAKGAVSTTKLRRALATLS